MSTPKNGQLWAARDALMSESDRLRHANRTGVGKSAAMSDYNRTKAQFNRIAKAIRGGRPVQHPERHDAHFESTVQGIPCGVCVLSYTPGQPGYGMEPHEAPEIIMVLLDRNGYRALWLEEKCSDWDWEMLECEAEAHHQASVQEGIVEHQVEQYRERYGL